MRHWWAYLVVATVAAALWGLTRNDNACRTDAAASSMTAPATLPTTRPSEDVAGVGNFAKISDTLYRGAQPTAEGFKTLEKMGIRTVVNLRALHDDTDLLAGTKLHYVHIPCNAWHPEEEDVITFLKIVQDPANQPVFVHCQHGADRTGMMVAAYRVVIQGWAHDDAAAELPLFGFHEVFATIKEQVNKFDAEKLRSKIDGTATKPAGTP